MPINEQKRLANVAVDAVFDSKSIHTTFRKELMEHGVIFCSISEAVHDYPDLIRKHLGSVVSFLSQRLSSAVTSTLDMALYENYIAVISVTYCWLSQLHVAKCCSQFHNSTRSPWVCRCQLQTTTSQP